MIAPAGGAGHVRGYGLDAVFNPRPRLFASGRQGRAFSKATGMPCTGTPAAAIIAALFSPSAAGSPVPGLVMIMKYRVLLPACLCAAVLAGCGQKGPLYMPAKPPAAPAAGVTPAPADTVDAPAASAPTDAAQDKDKKKDASSRPAAPTAQP